MKQKFIKHVKFRFFIYIFFIFFFIQNVMYIAFSFNFFIEENIVYLCISISIGFLMLLYFRKNELKKKIILIFIITSIITFATGKITVNFQIQKTKLNANTIILGLEKYYLKNNKYPEKIECLGYKFKNYSIIGILPKKFEYANYKNYYTIQYKDFKENKLYNSKNRKWLSFD